MAPFTIGCMAGGRRPGASCAAAKDGPKGHRPRSAAAPPWRNEFIEVLTRLKETLAEPWGVFVNGDVHLEATDRTGLAGRRAFFPYGLVELEPSLPMMNVGADGFRVEMQRV